jgi:hypothetical protein
LNWGQRSIQGVVDPSAGYDPIAILNRTGDVSAVIGVVNTKAVTLLKGNNFIVQSAAEMAEAIRKIEDR